MVAFPEHFDSQHDDVPDLFPVLEAFGIEKLGEKKNLDELALLLWIEVSSHFSEQYIPQSFQVIRSALDLLLQKVPVHWRMNTGNGKCLEMSVVPKYGTWNASYRLSDPGARVPELSSLDSYSENVFRLEEFPEVMAFVFRKFFRIAIENTIQDHT